MARLAQDLRPIDSSVRWRIVRQRMVRRQARGSRSTICRRHHRRPQAFPWAYASSPCSAKRAMNPSRGATGNLGGQQQLEYKPGSETLRRPVFESMSGRPLLRLSVTIHSPAQYLSARRLLSSTCGSRRRRWRKCARLLRGTRGSGGTPGPISQIPSCSNERTDRSSRNAAVDQAGFRQRHAGDGRDGRGGSPSTSRRRGAEAGGDAVSGPRGRRGRGSTTRWSIRVAPTLRRRRSSTTACKRAGGPGWAKA